VQPRSIRPTPWNPGSLWRGAAPKLPAACNPPGDPGDARVRRGTWGDPFARPQRQERCCRRNGHHDRLQGILGTDKRLIGRTGNGQLPSGMAAYGCGAHIHQATDRNGIMDHERDGARLRATGYGWVTPQGAVIACDFGRHLEAVAGTGALPSMMADFRRLTGEAARSPDDFDWPLDGDAIVADARDRRDRCRWDIVDALYAGRWIRLGISANPADGMDIEAEGASDALAARRADLELLAAVTKGELSRLAVRGERLAKFCRPSRFGQVPSFSPPGTKSAFRTACQALAKQAHGWMAPGGRLFAVMELGDTAGLEASGPTGEALGALRTEEARLADALDCAAKPNAERFHLAEFCWTQDRIAELRSVAVELLGESGWLQIRIDNEAMQGGLELAVHGRRTALRAMGPDLRDVATLTGSRISACCSDVMFADDPWAPSEMPQDAAPSSRWFSR